MKVVCPFCGGKAHILSRNNLNAEETVSELYCQCIDAQQCGALVVYSLAFKHTVHSPARTTLQVAQTLITRLSKEERAALLAG